MISQSFCKDCYKTHDRSVEDCYIPDVGFPYYVMSYDPFFSGWEFNKGLRNTPVVPCRTYEEAKETYYYVLSRRDQKNVRIAYAKPRHRRGRVLNIVSGWKRPKSERTDEES